MKEDIHIFDRFVSYLTPGHLEGLILFIVSTAIITTVHIYFNKEWRRGLAGANGLWEGPEILTYLCFWIFPVMIFSSGFLQLNYPDIAWYTLIAFMMFGLTGRWGLEWLLAFRGGAAQVTSTTTEKTVEKDKTTTTENK